ncbi:hypothetical protein BDV19DRAFT_396798 [Aspergillus venezuelensis]
MASPETRRSLKCDVCSRSFGRYEHLQRHSRTHTKEKPYICKCGRSFTRKDLLTRHERLNHSQSSPPRNVDLVTPVTPSSDLQQNLTHIAADSTLPTEYLPTNDNDILLSGQDDPIFDYARLLNAPEFNLDSDSFIIESILNHQDVPLDDVVVPQTPMPSNLISPSIPDDFYGDDDFRELKPVRCPWLMPEAHRMQLYGQIKIFSHVLPSFVFPSRFAIARYMGGYVDGFSHHHPFIHIPTLRLLNYAKTPELVLGILSIGAQYRYETKTALSLYEAARAIVLERVRRGDFVNPNQKTPQGEVLKEAAESPLLSHNWMDRIRALVLLFVFASWQIDPTLVQQSFEYQSLIARCLREVGLSEHSLDIQHDWLEWARHETDRRTKLFAWCLLSLHGLAFDTPPILLSRELNLFLPSTCKEWISRNEADWRKAQADAVSRAMFKEAHASHLATNVNQSSPQTASPMGNYILVHALIQRIYLAQQLSHDPHSQSLDPSVIMEFEVYLNHWRHTWRTSPESTLDLHNPHGSLSFTSTALLGLAHIRLHCNFGQWRDLQSCNPEIVAATLHEALPPQRGPQIIYALLHSVHALNLPVQIGLSYYSNCKAYSWSIQHALCNIECAAFLSKWLLVISSSCTTVPLSDLELQIIKWIGRVVREGLLSHDDTIALLPEIRDANSTDPQATTARLSYAVVKVWAQMFKLCNNPWPIVRLIGRSLDQYAALVHASLSGSTGATREL